MQKSPPVFFDFQTSTPLLPGVMEVMRPYFSEHFAASGSVHAAGCRVREALKEARRRVGEFVGASDPFEEIVFTSGGTEAVNLAIAGSIRARGRGVHILCTGGDSPAVSRTVEALCREGCSVSRVPVDGKGFVLADRLGELCRAETALICTHLVNADVGTLQRIGPLASLARERKIPLFVDAIAGAGWVELEVEKRGIDLLAFSPHRFYGPKGAGVLYRRRTVSLEPILRGGMQEMGLRAGTENIPALVGAGEACRLARAQFEERVGMVRTRQGRLWEKIRGIPGLILNGPEPGPDRSPVTLHVTLPGVENEYLVLKCDQMGLQIAGATGCVSPSARIPESLEAIGLSPEAARCSVMLGVGLPTTEEDVDRGAALFAAAVEKLRMAQQN
ncbi:MAG: cysteine desulfurase family protein [Verrucomicrobiae bacterium]|nr:cysteine desulfurase family protein [Verrucomicrobiae bacterium]